MNTYILKESDIETYYNSVLKTNSSLSASMIMTDLLGLECMDVEDAKKRANIGDCLLFEYDGKMLPFQVIHKYPNGRCVMSSYYVLDNHIFDEKSNVWRDSSIRKYMNDDMAKKFNPEVLKLIKEHDVHTEDYVTKDKFWLLSHEEIGYKDESNMFKKNVGAETFDYYKQN